VDSSAVIGLARALRCQQPRPILADAHPILVAGSDRDLAGAGPFIVREFRASEGHYGGGRMRGDA
jgi:hypothetical protein